MNNLPADSPRHLGIPCPGCGTVLDSVLFTRKAAGQILRVRKCEKCRRRIRTAERVVSANSPGRAERAADVADGQPIHPAA